MKRKRPKNPRSVIPRVCIFCRSYVVLEAYPDPDGWTCEREGYDCTVRNLGPGGLAACKHTCDRFESIFNGDGLDHINGAEVAKLVDEAERVLLALRQDGLPKGDYPSLARAIEQLTGTGGIP